MEQEKKSANKIWKESGSTLSFKEWIESSFKVQKKRKETKVPFAVKQKRLLTKKRKAEIKKMRKVDY